MYPALAPLAIAFVVTALVTSSPLARIPIGFVLGMVVLESDVGTGWIVVVGALGVTAGRIMQAVAARKSMGAGTRLEQQSASLRAFLDSSSSFARVSFLMGALPFITGRVTFPLLGVIGAPLHWAAAGSVLGSLPVLAITTSLSTWLATVAVGEDDAAAFLGIISLTVLVVRLLAAIDVDHWREHRKLRLRDEPDMTSRLTYIGGSGDASAFDVRIEREFHAGGDDMIEGEVLDEEVLDDEPAGQLDAPAPSSDDAQADSPDSPDTPAGRDDS